MTKESTGSGCGNIFYIATIVLLILKLTNLINISWLGVFFPILFIWGIVLVMVVITLVITLIMTIKDNTKG